MAGLAPTGPGDEGRAGRAIGRARLIPAAANADHGSARHAILCMLGGAGLYAASGAIVKAMGSVPLFELVFFRGSFAFLTICPLLWRSGGVAALRTRHPRSHLGRVLAGFCGMSGIYYGLKHLPIATVTGLDFATPLAIIALSAVFLGERIGARRGVTLLVGILGMLLVVRPWRTGGQGLPLSAVGAAMLGVLGGSLAMISIRRMGRLGERNVTIVAWFALGAAALGGALAIPDWRWPGLAQLPPLAAIGVLGGVAQMLMTEAYRTGETAVIAPFEYVAIVYTTTLGFVVWGEFPDAISVAGIAVIIGCGISIWYREVLRGRSP